MSIKDLRIIFFGTPDFAVPALKSLIEAKYNISAVITASDKQIGRKQTSTPPPVKVFAVENKIQTLQPATLKDDVFFEKFRGLNPDLCIIAAYGKIIPKRYIDLPKYGFVNIHPSLLPKYRGPSPIQSAILNGEKETGVSIILIDEEVDHGPILAKREFSILNFKFSNSKELETQLSKLGAELLTQTLLDWVDGKIKPQEQNHSQATFTKMLKREDGKIDWSWPAEKIYNIIRALNPEPGTWTTWQDKIINITQVKISDHKSAGEHGLVKKEGDKILIKAEDGWLEILAVQLEGKKEISAKDFTNGHKNLIGSTLI